MDFGTQCDKFATAATFELTRSLIEN